MDAVARIFMENDLFLVTEGVIDSVDFTEFADDIQTSRRPRQVCSDDIGFWQEDTSRLDVALPQRLLIIEKKQGVVGWYEFDELMR